MPVFPFGEGLQSHSVLEDGYQVKMDYSGFQLTESLRS